MFSAQNISVRLGKKDILRNINLDIKPNEFLAILGPNGSGKSTFLKSINKEIPLKNGQVYIEGKSIQEFSTIALAKKRSVLNQIYHFPYSFISYDIVEMGLFAHQNKNAKKIINDVVDMMEIKNLIYKNYQDLSGGERQKIQLARVIAQIYASSEYEKYIFLDEPTNNLDVFYQYKILNITKKLVEQKGIGVCAILHDINFAFIYSDKVAILKEGALKYAGDTQEVLTHNNIQEIFGVKSEIMHSKKFDTKYLVTYL